MIETRGGNITVDRMHPVDIESNINLYSAQQHSFSRLTHHQFNRAIRSSAIQTPRQCYCSHFPAESEQSISSDPLPRNLNLRHSPSEQVV
jgi:hypothetical protein